MHDHKGNLPEFFRKTPFPTLIMAFTMWWNGCYVLGAEEDAAEVDEESVDQGGEEELDTEEVDPDEEEEDEDEQVGSLTKFFSKNFKIYWSRRTE